MKTIKKYIDLTYLKDLSNGSNEFISQMISVFMVQTPEALDTMERCLNSKDWTGLHAVSHKIKASFAFMGIKELEPVIISIEENCLKRTNMEQLPEMVSKIKSVCEVAIEQLEIEKKLFI